MASFWFEQKEEKKNIEKARNFAHSYLGNSLCDFLQIWYVVFLGRQAPPQQLSLPLDKRSQSYECMKNCNFVIPINM